jgi:hypothetical protein
MIACGELKAPEIFIGTRSHSRSATSLLEESESRKIGETTARFETEMERRTLDSDSSAAPVSAEIVPVPEPAVGAVCWVGFALWKVFVRRKA